MSDNSLSKSDSMAVRRPNGKLPLSPRFRFKDAEKSHSFLAVFFMECVDIFHLEIPKIRMVASLSGGNFIGTFPEHQRDTVSHEKVPKLICPQGLKAQ